MIKPIFIASVMTLAFTLTAKAQDSIKTISSRPQHPNEIGLSILSPLILISGAQDYSGRFTNLSYRRWLTPNKSIRAFVGANFMKEADPYTQPYNSGIIPTVNPITYQTQSTTNNNNFQFGLGFDYYRGKRLMHGPGVDLVYNFLYEKNEYYYMKVYQTKDTLGNITDHFDRLDSGANTIGTNINKLGLNLSYSLRYQISPRWSATASATASFRLAMKDSPYGKIYNFDFSMVGILSDISLYYRF